MVWIALIPDCSALCVSAPLRPLPNGRHWHPATLMTFGVRSGIFWPPYHIVQSLVGPGRQLPYIVPGGFPDLGREGSFARPRQFDILPTYIRLCRTDTIRRFFLFSQSANTIHWRHNFHLETGTTSVPCRQPVQSLLQVVGCLSYPGCQACQVWQCRKIWRSLLPRLVPVCPDWSL